MKALRVQQLSPDFSGCVLEDVPMPEPGQGEVLVKVQAAAVNFPDILMTKGEYQFEPPPPFTLGMEYSGEVVALGDGVAPEWLGQAVVGGGKGGAFADYAVAEAKSLRRKPQGLSFAQASAFTAAYLTAYVTLVRRGDLASGEWVLVHGASGGVGLATVDLALRLGAKVIAAGGSDAKLERIDALYHPTACVNSQGGFRDAVKRLTDGRGADLIVDPVGGDVFDESVRCIAFGGRLLVVGFASGRIPDISVNMPLIKGFSVVGVRAGEYGRQFPERGRENLAQIDALAARGEISPHVDAQLPLSEWREGFRRLMDRQVVGKVVLIP